MIILQIFRIHTYIENKDISKKKLCQLANKFQYIIHFDRKKTIKIILNYITDKLGRY